MACRCATILGALRRQRSARTSMTFLTRPPLKCSVESGCLGTWTIGGRVRQSCGRRAPQAVGISQKLMPDPTTPELTPARQPEGSPRTDSAPDLKKTARRRTTNASPHVVDRLPPHSPDAEQAVLG